MNKITNYMVTQTGARRTVTFTIERPAITAEDRYTEAVTYSYGPREPMPQGEHEDGWQYTLPSGETYTHPNKHGCLHMILSDAIGADTAHTRSQRPEPVVRTHNRL